MARTNIVLLIPILASLANGAKITSKTDTGEEELKPPATLSGSVLKAFGDVNQGADLVSKSPVIIPRQSPHSFRLPGQRRPGDDDYEIIEEFLESKRRKNVGNPFITGPSNHNVRNTKPTIVNNIHVTINTNDSGPGIKGCRDDVCDVRVSSNPDGNGNLVTDVHLSFVTKLGKVPDVGIIPVIDGFPDDDNERRSNYDELPAFHFVDQRIPYNAQFFDNAIPQIPIHRQHIADFEPWYQTPRIIERVPAGVWDYARNFERGHKGLRGHRAWVPSGGTVDDKIEPPPTSKTKSGTDQHVE